MEIHMDTVVDTPMQNTLHGYGKIPYLAISLVHEYEDCMSMTRIMDERDPRAPVRNLVVSDID